MPSASPGPGAEPDDSGDLPVGELRQDPGLLVRDLLRPSPRAASVAVPWKQLFSARDVHELLGRLAEGDPLDVRTRVRVRTRKAALLLHADRLLLRAVALIAFRAPLYAGRPPIDPWCDELVAFGAGQLLREDAAAELQGSPLADGEEVHYVLFRELFGIAPAFTRRASVRYHALPEAVRRVIWPVVVEGVGPDELAGRGLGTPDRIRERLDLGFATLTSPLPLSPAELPLQDEVES